MQTVFSVNSRIAGSKYKSEMLIHFTPARFYCSVILVLLLSVCSCDYPFGDNGEFPAADAFFVLTSDNMGSSGFALFQKGVMKTGSADFHTDAVVVSRYPFVYVLNRYGRDNIQVLHIGDSYRTVAEISLVNDQYLRPNPQDMVFKDDHAFISCYDSDEIAVIDTATLEIENRLSLTSYGYKGSACPSYMYYDEDKNVFLIALQRLDREVYLPSDYSAVITADPDTLEIKQEIRLRVNDTDYTNPYTRFRKFADDGLLIGCTGHFKMTGKNDDDGAVLLLKKGPEGYYPADMILHESTVGADISDFVYVDGMLYIITLGKNGESRLVRAAPHSEQTEVIIENTGGKGYLWRIESHDSLLYICSRDVLNPGLLVYDTVNRCFLYGGILSTGLPPSDIVYIEGSKE